MSVDQETVRRIAQLARLRVPEDRVPALQTELNQILDWVDQLADVDVSGVEPMTNAAAASLPLRADVVTEGDQPDRVLANAPHAEYGYFAVPKVIE